MRAKGFTAAALLLTFGCGGKSNGGTGPGTDLGFLIQVNTAPPSTAAPGVSIPISFKILHRESSGGTTPVAGKAVTFTVTGGGGTVGGSSSITVSSAADGTVTTTWLLGSSLGAQTLRVGVSATEYLDVTVTAIQPPPTQLSLTTQPSASARSGAALA